MEQANQTPLARRLQSAVPRRVQLPQAMGMCGDDFFGVVGEITRREEQYQEVYSVLVRPYEKTDGSLTRVYDLVAKADELEPLDKSALLFRLLVEPFDTMRRYGADTTERKEE